MLYDNSITLLQQWHDCTAFYIPWQSVSVSCVASLYRLTTPLCLTSEGTCLAFAVESAGIPLLEPFLSHAARHRREAVTVITVCGDGMRHGALGVRLMLRCAEEKLRLLSVSDHRVTAAITPDRDETFRTLYRHLRAFLV